MTLNKDYEYIDPLIDPTRKHWKVLRVFVPNLKATNDHLSDRVMEIVWAQLNEKYPTSPEAILQAIDYGFMVSIGADSYGHFNPDDEAALLKMKSALEKDGSYMFLQITMNLHLLTSWCSGSNSRVLDDDRTLLLHLSEFPRLALMAHHYNPKPLCTTDKCGEYKCTNRKHPVPNEVKETVDDMQRMMTEKFEVIFGDFFNANRPAHITDEDVEVVRRYLSFDFVECKLTSCYDAYMDNSQPIDEEDRALNAARLAAAVAVVSKI